MIVPSTIGWYVSSWCTNLRRDHFVETPSITFTRKTICVQHLRWRLVGASCKRCACIASSLKNSLSAGDSRCFVDLGSAQRVSRKDLAKWILYRLSAGEAPIKAVRWNLDVPSVLSRKMSSPHTVT